MDERYLGPERARKLRTDIGRMRHWLVANCNKNLPKGHGNLLVE